MPGPGTPFNSFALPYRIRIDAFTQLPATEKQPAIHLLTHTHTDHLTGLSSKSFSSIIYCSRDAKEMLLRHQAFMDRALCQEQLKSQSTRTFSHLKVDPVMKPDGSHWFVGARDLLKPLPLNTPTLIELEHGEEVTLTLIDANHCPGAVMYLIEGRKGAVLHTGDFRVEPWFLESLSRNPYLQPYLAPLSTRDHSFVSKPLEAIYLDTACAFSTLFVPTKEQAITGLIELIKCYPPDTHFFINAWTWGYEDILKSVSRAFQSQIHVDKYKFSVYQRVSDPFLRSIVTLDAGSTRFHACERFHLCDHVALADDIDPTEYEDVPFKSRTGKRVLYVNPLTMAVDSWNIYLEDTKKSIRTTGQVVNCLLIPLWRHSPLPELQSFVRLFRPKRVIPNALDPRLRGLDWICLDHMFAPCLNTTTTSKMIATPTPRPSDLDMLTVQVDEESDTAFKNIVGPSDLASKWANKANLRDKLDIMIGYLDPDKKSFFEKLLRVRPPDMELPLYASRLIMESPPPVADVGRDHNKDGDSEDGSDDGADREEDHWRTAEALFGDSVADEERLYSKAYGNADEDEDLERQLTPPMTPVLCVGSKRPHDNTNHDLTPPPPKKRTMIEPQILASPIHISSKPKRRVHAQADGSQNQQETTGSSPHWGQRDENVSTPGSASAINQADIARRRTSPGADHQHNLEVTRSSPSSGRRISITSPDSRHDTPNSPSSSEAIIRRKLARLERMRQSLELADKLARANPGRVVSTYHQARERLMKECVRNEVKVQYLEALRRSNIVNVVPDPFLRPRRREVVEAVVDRDHGAEGKSGVEEFEDVEGSQIPVDWKKSEELAEKVREAVATGRRLGTVIPPLACTEEDW